jgi:hypothetical protein
LDEIQDHKYNRKNLDIERKFYLKVKKSNLEDALMKIYSIGEFSFTVRKIIDKCKYFNNSTKFSSVEV